MSQKSSSEQTEGGGRGRVIDDTTRLETLFGALEDEDCRAILEATREEVLTANELSAACDLPLSTAYRKLEQLTETGLLEERLRLAPDGRHTSEYARTVDELHVSLDKGVTLSMSTDDSEAGIPASAD